MPHPETGLPLPLGASWLVLVLPLLSFIVNGLWLGRKNRRAAAWLSTGLTGLNLAWTVALAISFYNTVLHHPNAYPDRILIPWNPVWMQLDVSLAISIGAFLDPISVMMLTVIASIGFLVHIYSIGYMKEDPSSGRFFALLSLFIFAMTGLVLATNLVQMFIFWELVGVSSYLLIGFWYHKPSAVAASKKAFIVTRFADAFFALAFAGFGFDAFLMSAAASSTARTILS